MVNNEKSKKTSINPHANLDDPARIKLFLDNGGNPNIKRSHNYNSPLLVRAVEHDKSEVVSLLLNHPNINPNARDNFDKTALHRAIRQNNSMYIDMLLNHPDIKPNQDYRNSYPPLHSAIYYDKQKAAKQLIQKNKINLDFIAQVLKREYGTNQLTPIGFSVFMSAEAVTNMILDYSEFRPGQPNNKEYYIIDKALSNDFSSDTIARLVKRGCNIPKGKLASVRSCLKKAGVDNIDSTLAAASL